MGQLKSPIESKATYDVQSSKFINTRFCFIIIETRDTLPESDQNKKVSYDTHIPPEKNIICVNALTKTLIYQI